MNHETTLHIIGATLIDPQGNYTGVQDVFIAQGKIVAIGKSPGGFTAQQTIQANGQWLIPGLVDLSARLREPGFEYKATLESEMQAALAGGVTSLACPPDTDPSLDEPGLVEMLKHRAQQLSQANVYPIGALTKGLAGEQLTEMAELTEAGCVAFSQADQAIINTQVLLRAMQYARTFNFPIWLRAQDPFLSHAGLAHLGALASRMGLVGIPVEAETIALQTYISLARATDVKLHICRVSSAAGIDLIRQAKAEGLKITCDVSIHHVHLCDNDMGFFDPHARLSPPLRSDRDRAAITEGLLDGTIDAICSDHSPVDADCKQLPFGEAEIGATALELLLPLTIQWGKQSFNGVSPTESAAKACAFITEKSAKILLPDAINIGKFAVGATADLCLFDPAQSWQVSSSNLYSQGHNTPFLNYEMQGKVTKTFVAGKLVYQAT